MSPQTVTAQPNPTRLWASRICVGLVLLWNLQAALTFIVWPSLQAPGFELSGEIGGGVIRSIGVLFLMWNVPYAVALWHPFRHRLSLYEAAAMQAIGVIGEAWVYLSLPTNHAMIHASLTRFLVFDSAGLVLLLIAVWITWPAKPGDTPA